PPTRRRPWASPPRASTSSVAASRCTAWTRSTRTRTTTAWSPRCRSSPTSPTRRPRRTARARATAAASSPARRRAWARSRSATGVPLGAARSGLGDEPAWIVGGAVRDRLLGRETTDLDLALAGDPETAARAVARMGGGTPFALSDDFGAWRVVGRGHAWHVDL